MGPTLVLIAFGGMVFAALVILWKYDSYVPEIKAATPPATGNTIEHKFDFAGFLMECLAALLIGLGGYLFGTALLPDGVGEKIREISTGLTAPPPKPVVLPSAWNSDPKVRTFTLTAPPEGLKWVARFQGQPMGTPLEDLNLKVPPGIPVVDLWYFREKDRVNGPQISMPTK